jgi:predicted dehydrogenase
MMKIEAGQPIRAGLIGYGFAGKTFHAPLIESVEGLRLTHVSSRKPEAVLADLPNVQVCDEPEAVATHKELDLVVIASPNESHFPLAAAALRAGKHVVVDKPFTVTLAESRSLVQIAQEQDRLLSVFHNRRWESESLAAQAILDSGMLGEVTHFETHIDRFRPNVRRRWREDPGPGAGLWFDLGPHLIDEALQMFGLPESIYASLAVLRKGAQTDDWAHVQLNYAKARVILHTSLLVAGGGPRTMLHGTLGSWMKYGADVQEKQLIAGLKPGSNGYGIDTDPGIFVDGATGERREIPAPLGDESMYYSGVRDALYGKAPNPVPPSKALAVMAVLERSFESAALGRVLPFEMTEQERLAWTAGS